MESIRQSVKSVLSVENHSKIIDQFARDRYFRKFPPSERDGLRYGGYHRYDGYEIISESLSTPISTKWNCWMISSILLTLI